MIDPNTSHKLTWMIRLLAANLIVLTIGSAALIFGLLPKLERAIAATERMEDRFHDFADRVQPVLTASAGKAIEAIEGMNAKQLSETATDKTDLLLKAAAEKAERFLEKDRADEGDADEGDKVQE